MIIELMTDDATLHLLSSREIEMAGFRTFHFFGPIMLMLHFRT